MHAKTGPVAAFLAILFAATGPSIPARAADFRDVVVSAAEDAKPQATFSTDTPEIFVRADMVDIVPGSTVTITWLAVDTGPDNPPNFRLNQVDLKIGPVGHLLRTSIARPGERWVPGAYRVRLSVNGQTLERTDFTIE